MITTACRYLCLAAGALTALAASAGPQIETWRTANGAAVYFVSAPEIPMLDVRVTFAAGSARDGAQLGVASLSNGLLKAGAGDLDANAFADALGATGAALGVGALRDMAYLGLRTLADARYADPALQLLEAAMARPRLDVDAIERAKARRLIGLRHKQQSPGTIAQEAFYAALYPDHPYGASPDGTEASITALTRADISAFLGRYYVARNAIIALVGAIDKTRAVAIAEQLSGALPSGESAPPLPEVAMTAGREEHIEFASIQSHVRVGLPGMSRNDPDYFPLLVGNHALGGNSLVSLLFEEIRSKRGLSYSAYSYFVPMAQPGPFVAVMQTDRSQQDEAMQVLHQTIANFIDAGPPPAALESAKQNLMGGFPLRIDSNAKITEYIGMIGFYGLPLDYLDKFTAKVGAVTPEAVAETFRRRIKTDNLVTVIVGRSAASATP
jgi:zinc protease